MNNTCYNCARGCISEKGICMCWIGKGEYNEKR
jgi:hypothetical protein